MLISHESAMRIVTEVSSIIDHDVNMMDEQGLIIASTDPARLGTVHGGARRLLKEGLDELIVENEDEYEGARPGVNLPLLFEGETVGVIGLTGRTDEVRQFGRIIKKMTEILLLDSWAERQKQLKAAMWNQFIEEWLFSSASQVDDAFAERGLQLGIDIREPRIVFVVALTGGPEETDSAAQEQLAKAENALHEIVRRIGGGFYYKLPYRLVCFMPPAEPEQLRALAEKIVSAAEAAELSAYIGIDTMPADASGIRAAYARADKALRAAMRGGRKIHFYDSADLEILAGELPAEARHNFLNGVFGRCSPKERAQIVDFLTVYYKHGGSVQATADALFVHKNTVQYKLHKILHLTGHDPRDLYGAAVLLAALAVRSSLGDDAGSVLRL